MPASAEDTLLIIALKFEGIDCMVNDTAPV